VKSGSEELNMKSDIDKYVGRLATIEFLVASATHEINNSLSAVIPKLRLIKSHFRKIIEVYKRYRCILESEDYKGFASKLDDLQDIDNKKIDACIDKVDNYISLNLEILKNVQKIAESLRDLKFLSEDVSGKIAVNDSVQKVLTLLDHQFEKKMITVITDLCPEDVVLKGSSGEFKQLVLNLLINSIDTLCEKKEVEHDFSPEIEIKTFKENGFFTLQVFDNGQGISPSIRDELFCAYTTTKKGKGSGLGLSIVKRIVEKLNGHIEFESELNKFTRFKLRFPVNTGD